MLLKRLVLLLLAGAMLFTLTSCGGEEAKETSAGLPDLSGVSLEGLKICLLYTSRCV